VQQRRIRAVDLEPHHGAMHSSTNVVRERSYSVFDPASCLDGWRPRSAVG
jgi:hypothetical protein